jgi:hypothetical protein
MMALQRFFQGIFLVGSAALLSTLACTSSAADEPAKTRKVEAGEIQLSVPDSWTKEEATSRMRVAQFAVPKAKGDSEGAQMVVFYFGGEGGSVNANVERWINQFKQNDRKTKLTSGKSSLGDYVLVDLSGTWKKPIGPPIRQQSEDAPGSRFLGVILTVKGQGNYFLRLAGPEKTVSANADAFRTMFGGNAKSEKEYKLPESE